MRSTVPFRVRISYLLVEITLKFLQNFKDVSGIIHVAVDSNFENLAKSDTDVTLKAAADSVLVLMKAAAHTSSVKSFVLTSSGGANFVSEYGKDVNSSLDDFTDHFIAFARATPVDSPIRDVTMCEQF